MLLAVVALLGILIISLGRGHVRARAFVARLIKLDIEITAEDRQSIAEHLGGAAARKGDREETTVETRSMLSRLQRMLACRILWVDDRPDGNSDENLALQRMGQSVTLATSSEDAEEVLRGGRFDLVITDITRGNDPEAGLAFIRRVRALRPRVPVIVYSDKADTYRQQARKLGATEVARYPSELLMAVIARLNPGWPAVYLMPEPTPLSRWIGEGRRRNPRLLAAVLAGVVAVAAVSAGSAVAVWRLTRPPCLAMQPGGPVQVGSDAATCPIRVGSTLLTLDCARELTVPADRLLTESRDYAGHPTPVQGDGTVLVNQGVCAMTSPRRGVETSLRTSGAPVGDGTAVVDFRPTTGATATFGMSVGGSPASRGLGVYLYVGAGGGEAAQDTGGARLAQVFPVQGGPEPDAFNRLVLCTQAGTLTAWLNGRQLGQAPDTGQQPGEVRLSLEDFDRSSAARVDVRRLSVFGSGGGCGA